MHEAAIAQSILQIASERLKLAQGATGIAAIKVAIGGFRNVEVESLQFAFDNLKDLYEGCCDCRLDAETVPARAICQEEGHCYLPTFENNFRCPECGAGIGNLISGEELNVTKLTFNVGILQEC